MGKSINFTRQQIVNEICWSTAILYTETQPWKLHFSDNSDFR